jgi:hypothetical protein
MTMSSYVIIIAQMFYLSSSNYSQRVFAFKAA